jgi:signal transduction histidine kinase
MAYQRSPGDVPTAAVRVRVTDSGIGVAPQDLAKLFQPFRQIETGLTRNHEGTGLGLAICSAFTVTLPVRRSATR